MPPPPPRRCLPAGNVRPEQTGSGGVPTPYPLATQQWAAPVGRTSRSSPLPVVLRRSGVHVFAQPGRYAERLGTMRRGERVALREVISWPGKDSLRVGRIRYQPAGATESVAGWIVLVKADGEQIIKELARIANPYYYINRAPTQKSII